MTVYQIIQKKRDGGELSREEIDLIIKGFVKGEIPDYQMSAFLMAVFIRGMNNEETFSLTESMLESGDKMDLSAIPGLKADKHSTGGVGDTTTLILAPLVAAGGVPMAKLSGRGLGHTGGTLDKLEAIPGFRTELDLPEFIGQVKKIGVAVAAQTQNLCPADKKIYALRDVTATVDSIPLICGSIMSKKLASGSDVILLDVKTGKGAFMKTLAEAKKLAKLMVAVGKEAKKTIAAVVTDMEVPLGAYIGNALEVKEAIEILNGLHQGTPLYEVSIFLAGQLLHMGGKAVSQKAGINLAAELIKSGAGKEKFKELIAAQGGNPEVVDKPELLPGAAFVREVNSPAEGYIAAIDALAIGMITLEMGAGRLKKDDPIDHGVGIILRKRKGDRVYPGEPLAQIFANSLESAKKAEAELISAFKLTQEKPETTKLILDFVD